MMRNVIIAVLHFRGQHLFFVQQTFFFLLLSYQLFMRLCAINFAHGRFQEKGTVKIKDKPKQ